MGQSIFNRFFKKNEDFGIAVYESDHFSFDHIQDLHLIYTRDIDSIWLKWKPMLTQADPFLFVKNDTLYLFFERVYAGKREWGRIAMTKTTDLVHWTKPVDVLSLSYHLSFPFVFEDSGEVYMIPESNEADAVCLYRANDNLTQFTFVRNLVEQPRTKDICFNFCDSHILKKDGIYYLFTSVSYRWKYSLELYYTDDLLNGKFQKHPQSPICQDNEYGRCGGSIIHLDDNYYRISQDCHTRYGENVSVIKICDISEDNYHEELYRHNVFSTGGKLYRDGVHQLNVVKHKDKYIYATDFQRLEWSWFQTLSKIRRLMSKRK
jgi:hypothetical protein